VRRKIGGAQRKLSAQRSEGTTSWTCGSFNWELDQSSKGRIPLLKARKEVEGGGGESVGKEEDVGGGWWVLALADGNDCEILAASERSFPTAHTLSTSF
jgi:hypothetical protein